MNKEKPKKEADKYDRNDHTFRDALRRHELQEITTTKKNGAIINNIYNYGAKPVSRFNFFSAVGIMVTMILCGIALAVGWMLVTSPKSILNWFGI
jgi:hypothetical protein